MGSSRQEQPEPDPLSLRGQSQAVPTVEVVPPGSARPILLQHLMREARDPSWSPLASARRMIGYADNNINLLRTARTRLIQVAPPDTRRSSSHARALATINIAIADLNERPHDQRPSARGAGGEPAR